VSGLDCDVNEQDYDVSGVDYDMSGLDCDDNGPTFLASGLAMM
jgi:hypothetical protein